MKINPKELEYVSKLTPFKRYEYFIKRVADFEEMYALQDTDGNWAIAAIDDKRLFSLWSAEAFAAAFAIGTWEGYQVCAMSITDFNDDIVPVIEEEGYLLNIFPVAERTGFVLNLDEFQRDLAEALEQYE